MRKTGKNPIYGLTLVETLIAVIIIVIAVLGSVLYRYHSALAARKADVNMTAARLSLLLLISSEVIIAPDSSLVLYVDDKLTFTNGATINNSPFTGIPANCQIYSTYSSTTNYIDFKFDNAADVYATIYAPKADIEIKNDPAGDPTAIYGAIIGATLKVDNNAEIHYDAALGKIFTVGAEFVTTRWREY